MTGKRLLTGALVASLLGGLLGCGGGGASKPAAGGGQTTGRGGIRITVQWPEGTDTRLIPSLTHSIVVAVTQDGSAVGGGTITRPDSSYELTDLPALPTTVTATAYPAAEARSRQGTALATATQNVQLVSDRLTLLVLTLGTTIVTVQVTPDPANVGVGETVALTATALDASNAVVMVPPTNPFAWTLLPGAVGADQATVDSSGLLSGVTMGSGPVTVQATEVESGVSGTATVNVGAGDVSGTISDPFAAGIADVAVALLRNSNTIGQTTTNAAGAYSFSDLAPGEVEVQASKAGFVGNSGSTTVQDGQTATVDLTLQPDSLPAAVTENARELFISGRGHREQTRQGGDTVDFEVTVVVLDADGTPVAGPGAAQFSIAPYSQAGTQFTFALQDTQPLSTGDGASLSAALLLDSSSSAALEDPSDLRLEAAKIFFDSLPSGDDTALGAFASAGSLPTMPLTVFPAGAFTTAGTSLFGHVDGLAATEGGSSPVYDAISQMADHTATNAAHSGGTIVVVTDGQDSGSSATVGDADLSVGEAGLALGAVFLGPDAAFGPLGYITNDTGGPMAWAKDPRQLIALHRGLWAVLHHDAAGYVTRWTASRTSGSFGDISGTIVIAVPGNGTIEAPFYLSRGQTL